MNQRRIGLLLFFLAITAAAQSQQWNHWKYFAAVEIAAAVEPGLVRLRMPAAVTARANPGWSDLRVVDDRGAEVPFILHAQLEKRSREWRDARLLEVSFVPGESTQAVVDTGAGGEIHNSVEIQTSERDYFVWVEVAVSHDSRAWRILHERAPLYRFSKENLDGNQVISYSPSNSRYLRLRVLEGAKKFPLDGARVAREMIEEAERIALDVPLAPDPGTPAQQSWWTADAGRSAHPVSQVRFDVEQPEFHRAVRITTSADGKTWRAVAFGDIYRIAHREKTQQNLNVTFPEQTAQHWRVEVINRNDAPLAGARPALYITPRDVIFEQQPGRAYRLFYGNQRAAAPQYEMSRILGAKAGAPLSPQTFPEARAAAEQVNSDWSDPRPFTERYPQLLWAALALAVVVLGALALRAMKN